MEESLSKFMAKSTKRQDENSNLIKEIRASMDAANKNQGASIKALEIQIGQMSKEVLGKLIDIREPATELKRMLREKPRIDFIVLDMPEDVKVPLILGRPCLSTAHAKIDVFRKNIALRVRDDKIVFKSDNPTSNIIRRVYALGLRERMEPDLEARLMREDLILNRSLDPMYKDYIELNDLNKPLEL
uniref:Reverse transcriptase domain-containing protein n=1 Tax=Tanacetum cinerariifolium TaxID=118510 RepID=A0A6L2JZR9_TANCI|nr:hypothetical protein [Tanacetum cinerariifolium]